MILLNIAENTNRSEMFNELNEMICNASKIIELKYVRMIVPSTGCSETRKSDLICIHRATTKTLTGGANGPTNSLIRTRTVSQVVDRNQAELRDRSFEYGILSLHCCDSYNFVLSRMQLDDAAQWPLIDWKTFVLDDD